MMSAISAGESAPLTIPTDLPNLTARKSGVHPSSSTGPNLASSEAREEIWAEKVGSDAERMATRVSAEGVSITTREKDGVRVSQGPDQDWWTSMTVKGGGGPREGGLGC